jgi:two-component system sensor histidine kinase TctE
MTIRRRLLLLLLPALAVLMVGGGLLDYWIAVTTTGDAFDRALASAAFAAVASPQSGDQAAGIQQSRLPTAFLRGDRSGGLRFYAISSSDGHLLAGNAELAKLPLPNSGSPSGKPVYADAQFGGLAVRVARLAVPTHLGNATVTVAETRERRQQAEHVMLLGKLLVDFGELDLTLLLIYIAVSFGLRPLARLRQQAENYSLRELQRFDDNSVPGELRPLVVAFNRVLELLHDAAAAQRRFVADAAHQMRTPVAGLLAQIELLQGEPRAAPMEADLGKLHRAAQSMAHSANQLLSLARAEPLSALQDERKPVALDQLVHELVERHLGRADQRGIDLGAEAETASVSGNRWLLEDLLSNLIDNALKYTPHGGRVTVRSGIEEGRPYLEVEDDGPGIPESERARVRERFYRSPGSSGIGAGLGLAIVEEIARAHEAVLTIGGGASGGGARLRVQFGKDTSAAPALAGRG